MTVSSIVPVNNYTGNSSVKKFDFDFLIEDASELIVQHTNKAEEIKILTLGVDYSINEIGNPNGSYIIFPLESSSYNVLSNDEKISLMLTLNIKQENEFKNSSYFNLNILEWTFDYIIRLLQILNRKVDRSVKISEGANSAPDEIIKQIKTSEVAAIQAANSANEAKVFIAENEALNIVAQDIQGPNNIANVLNNKNNIDTVANSISNVDIVGNSINNVNIVAANKDNINILVQSNDKISTCAQNINDIKTAPDYAQTAKKWAVSDSIIENGLYSAKYYAMHAQGLSEVKYSDLRAGNAFENNGRELFNEEAFSDVQTNAHSTFDSSKFTRVGKPIITEEGIASWNNNPASYWEARSTVKLSELNGKSWEIRGSWINKGISRRPEDETKALDEGIIVIGAPAAYGIVENYNNTAIRFTGRFGDLDENTSEIQRTVIAKTWAQIGLSSTPEKFIAKLSFDITTGEYALKVKVNEENDWRLVGTYTPSTTDKQLWNLYNRPDDYVSVSFNSEANTIYNASDLKQFSISIDGFEVFNGNKTGIDIIKPDDYRVIGSPIITEDSVATNMNSSNYVSCSIDLKNAKQKIEIDFLFKFPQKLRNAHRGIFAIDSDGLNINSLYIYQNQPYLTFSSFGGTFTDLGNLLGHTLKVNIILKSDDTYTINYKDLTTGEEVSKNGTNTIFSELINQDKSLIKIGWGNAIFDGYFDLNSLKVLVDDNLVYQACLKIPYTESKTGSKIVNSVYRDRVQSFFEEFGYNEYFTCGDEDFTLPTCKGDDIVKSYRNGINYYEQKANRILEQGGSCTADEHVNFLKPYTDENYILSVPYLEKTKTGFTPTVSGDWISKGMIMLGTTQTEQTVTVNSEGD